jgi:excisionase family DNA binding protein
MPNERLDLSDYISGMEAARLLGCSRQWIYQLSTRKKIISLYVAGHHLISRASIEKYRENPDREKFSLKSTRPLDK